MLAPRGAAGTRLRGTLGRAAMRVLPRMPRLRVPLTLLGVASAALLAWQHQHLWGQELSSLSPVPQEAIRFDESLRADLASDQGGALVVVQAADAEAALQAAEQAGAVLDRLVAQGTLGAYQSAARLLPSVHRQLARQTALPDAPTLRAALAQATEGGPLGPQRLQAFVDDVQRARQLEPMRPQTLSNAALAPLLDTLLLKRGDGSWAALLPLQAAATPLDPAALRAALADVPGVQVLVIPLELRRLYRHYLNEAQVQALLGALAVVVLIAAGLRSWQRVRAVCQPLLLAVLLLMASLHLLQVPMGILHLVGLLLVVALGSNYALFFNAPHGDGGVDEDTLASLLLVSLTTATSFGLIALSAIPALSTIGQVVSPGTLLVLVLAAAYAPKAAPRLEPRARATV
jgi:predicted exporter